jgi:TatD DNase family protein
MKWIDTHCHLDAPELQTKNSPLPRTNIASLAIQNIAFGLIPAVETANFDRVRTLAHGLGFGYGLGIHPLYVLRAQASDLQVLAHELAEHAADPRLLAVGEIGLDFFVPVLCTPAAKRTQTDFYLAQLKLALQHDLPVVLHVRKSADELLAGLNRFPVQGGIAHAFNGSLQQAQRFLDKGFKLGFGGAVTYERALHLRELVVKLPLDAIVLETDSPDIPPHWLYVTAEDRAKGTPQGINTPAQLPRIAQVIADLRGMALEDLAAANVHNACAALPKLKALL